MIRWIVDKRHVGTHGSCVRSNNHVYKLSIQLKPAFNGRKTSTPQPKNRIAVSLFALALCVDFIHKSTKTVSRFRCLYLLYVLVSFINQLKPHSSFVVYRAVLACNANAVMGTSDSKATPSVLRFLSITIAYGCMDFTF